MGADNPSAAREHQVAIKDLSPTLAPGWYVVARVVNVAPIRTWENSRGIGKLLVMELQGSSGARVHAKAFNDCATLLEDVVKFDRVYAIHGVSLRKANPDYTNAVHPYELLLSQDTRMEVMLDDGSIQHAETTFVTIEDLVKHPLGSYVDILAIVVEIGDLDCVLGKNGKVQMKRDILLVDTSNVQVMCTLWNEFSSLPVDGWLRNAIAIRYGRLTNFRGRSIGTTAKTTIIAKPPYPEKCASLEQWFHDGYGDQPVPIHLLVCTFTPIDKIRQVESDTVVDVIAVVTSVATVRDIVTMDGRTLHKREIVLVDPSGISISCSLWGLNADRVDDTWNGRVVAITSARVSDFNGRSISTRSASSVLLDPPIEQAQRLSIWHHNLQRAMNDSPSEPGAPRLPFELETMSFDGQTRDSRGILALQDNKRKAHAAGRTAISTPRRRSAAEADKLHSLVRAVVNRLTVVESYGYLHGLHAS